MINGNKGKESEGLKMMQGGLGDAEELSTPIFSHLLELNGWNALTAFQEFLLNRIGYSAACHVGYSLGLFLGYSIGIAILLLLKKI